MDHVQGQVTPYGLLCGPVRRGPALRGSVHSDDQGVLHESVLRTDAAGASGSVGRGRCRPGETATADLTLPAVRRGTQGPTVPPSGPVLPSRPPRVEGRVEGSAQSTNVPDRRTQERA
ncbi:hypothetical protein Slala02_10630 [Streptomyces lavendulae subsp. lavendulae]|nr:hypothetical protein Slala01_02660 [Streptomyces lavendulae subsp. lavendulae]GLX25243.1 hypothetical protein Slala02_10630 [Streptomyces lavendulae subsp. lavendulae]